MKKFYIILGFIFWALIPDIRAQEPQPFARFPSVSPDGSAIAFSYQGDIWTIPSRGGRAIRLTVHEAYESNPQWSPGGQRIAFTSDRHGNDDLFVMDADGSNIRQLTYHSASDELTGWMPDNRLLFTTQRLYNQVEWAPEVHTIPAEGGTPTRFLNSFGYMAAASPDGRFLVFVRGYNRKYRIGYRGPANKDLWIYDTRAGTYRQLTNFQGNDMYPTFAGNRTLYFLSEREGVHNIYKTKITQRGTFSSTPRQLTHLTEDGIRHFDVSRDGKTIVAEYKTGIYTLINEQDLQPLSMSVSRDSRYYTIERKTFSDEAREFVVSPNGKYLAFVVAGDIFIKHNDPSEKRAVRLTDHPYRDRDIAFLDDSTLIFSSDRNGQYDLYSLQPAEGTTNDLFESFRRTISRLTSTPKNERHPVISSDGEKIAFNRGRGQLIVANITAQGQLVGESILLDTGWASARDVTWSPDNQWLAYALPNLNFNTEIYIHPVDNSSGPVNISKHPRPDTDPVWSPDGSKLAFLSSRNNGDNDIWFAWLSRRDWERTELDWQKSQKSERVAAEDTAHVNVTIDFDRIYQRLQQVTSLPGNESDIAISKDGKTFYFVSNRDDRQEYNADQDLYRVNWNGRNIKALTDQDIAPSGLRLNTKLNALYFMQKGGTIKRYKDSRVQALPFRAEMTINHRQQREQIFEEAWRTIGTNFYDPNFHGHNWPLIHDHYKPWALQASSDRDFEDVMNMMLGQLNASHMGFYSSDRAETQDLHTGLLGVEIEPVPNGVEIQRVVPHSPADRVISKLHAGEIITHVGDQAVAKVDNFYSLLADKVNTPTLLTIQSAEGENREVVIEPTRNLDDELYNQWVEKRKELTEQYSNGRLGYLHIEGMNWPSFERFERELVATGENKDGIVIDVRYNGGGWTTDYLLTVLTYPQHAYTIPRGATPNLQQNKTKFREHYPFGERLPLSSWTGQSIALANEHSYSNAEIFAHAYKQLNLGTLVGEPTFGAVISTGGKELMGGAYIRVPFRGWFVRATNKNMEHGPAIPDVQVENPPDYRNGKDIQLQQAVDILLQQIDSSR